MRVGLLVYRAYPVRSRCQLSIPGLAYCEPGIVIDVECDNVLAPVLIPPVGGLGRVKEISKVPPITRVCGGCIFASAVTLCPETNGQYWSQVHSPRNSRPLSPEGPPPYPESTGGHR